MDDKTFFNASANRRKSEIVEKDGVKIKTPTSILPLEKGEELKEGDYNEKLFKKIKKNILDLLFPVSCLGCKKEGAWLCDDCFKSIPINQKILLSQQIEEFFNPYNDLKNIPSYLDRILIASSYKNKSLNNAIKTLKYNFAFDLAEPLGKILIKFLRQFDLAEKNDFLLIPMPLHKKRFIWRGFNQSELLAKKVGKFFSMEVNSKILKREKNAQPQIELKEKERQKNVKNIFAVPFLPPKELFNKKIILIDDVATTGSTLQEAGKELKKAGFKEVWGLVLAKG